MPSKQWLDTIEQAAQKVANGPDTNNHDPKYWAQWGNFLGDYIKLVDAKAVLELVGMARKTTSTMIVREDLMESKRYKDTHYLLEVSSTERDYYWQTWALDGKDFGRRNDNRVEWEQKDMVQVRVGELGTHPIVVTYFWHEINRSSVCFWEATSAVVDYGLIEAWNKKHFTQLKDERTDTIQSILADQKRRREKHAK